MCNTREAGKPLSRSADSFFPFRVGRFLFLGWRQRPASRSEGDSPIFAARKSGQSPTCFVDLPGGNRKGGAPPRGASPRRLVNPALPACAVYFGLR